MRSLSPIRDTNLTWKWWWQKRDFLAMKIGVKTVGWIVMCNGQTIFLLPHKVDGVSTIYFPSTNGSYDISLALHQLVVFKMYRQIPLVNHNFLIESSILDYNTKHDHSFSDIHIHYSLLQYDELPCFHGFTTLFLILKPPMLSCFMVKSPSFPIFSPSDSRPPLLPHPALAQERPPQRRPRRQKHPRKTVQRGARRVA